MCVPECICVHHTHPMPMEIRNIRSPKLWLPMVVNHRWVLRTKPHPLRGVLLVTTKPPPAPSHSI